MQTNATNLLLIAAAVAVIGGMGLSKISDRVFDREYVPGTTTEYHPSTHADRQDAAEALRETGFQAASGESVAGIFEPAFQDGHSVAFDVRLSHEQIESNEPQQVHAAVSILATDDVPERKRPPLDVALVIDRSGSMLADDKMVYARAASHALIDALGPEDQVAIVSYSTTVTTHVTATNPATDRAKLHQIIDALDCYGGTNISAGLEAGRAALGRTRDGALARVVLLSDGQANNGVTGVEGLSKIASDTLEHGVSVSTMGMGLDYDEVVMQGISRAGAGNYYFIDDVAKTEQVFGKELGDLTGAVARNATLHVTLGQNVLLDDVHGFPYRRTADGFEIPLDSFTRGERKDLLIAVDMEGSGEAKVFDAELRYTDVQTEKATQIASSVTVETGWSAEPFVPVMKRVQQIRTINAFQKAMELYDRGQRYDAADLLEKQREENRDFLDDADIKDRAFERVDGKLTQLAEALRKTDVHSTQGKWIKKATFQYANDAVHSEVAF